MKNEIKDIKPRIGTKRLYRSNINGLVADASKKIRWAILLREQKIKKETIGGQPSSNSQLSFDSFSTGRTNDQKPNP